MTLIARNLYLLRFAIAIAFWRLPATVIDAFDITLTCEDPCTDIAQEGFPPAGHNISLAWNAPEIGPLDLPLFSLHWGGNLTDEMQAAVMDLENFMDTLALGPNNSVTFSFPEVFIPPGNHYFIRATYTVNSTGALEFSSFGPYRFNDAYSTYPIPNPNPMYNFTVTVDCPAGVDCSDGVTIYAGEDAVVRWTLPPNQYDLADVRLYWGNHLMYSSYRFHLSGSVIYINRGYSTSNRGGFYASEGQNGISFTNIIEARAPPPGDHYYMMVFLSNHPRYFTTQPHDIAYSARLRIEPSRSSGSNNESRAVSDLANSRLLEIVLGTVVTLVITLYCC